MSEATSAPRFEYATVPLLTHATKQILDGWGDDGWELVSVVPAPLPEGSEVILRADHMPGMDGANATIDSSTQETVYMVDVHSEDMPMTNHKWVTESEVQPAP